MVLGVCVEQTPDHPLILGVVLFRLAFEELDAALAESERYLYPFVPKDQVFGARQKVGNNLKLSEGLVCVFDFRVHRVAFLFANNLLRKYGLHRPGK